MSVIIPVFVLTAKGVNFACSYFSGLETAKEIDLKRQYVVSQVPMGDEIRVGNFRAYLCETRLPVRSKRELC
jgi:hypothetical protein